MGIRYDKDNRKATNGPLIFFSIYQDRAFEEEIRSAFVNGLSFYAYRFPGDTMMTYGSSESFIEGVGQPGFVIGMFNPQLPILTIPYKGIKEATQNTQIYKYPGHSTSYETYRNEVEKIINDLKAYPSGKVVAARVVKREKTLDIAEEFFRLSHKFPEAFVYCFSTPATGCWIGASPELLLEGKDGKLLTMALAGTRESTVHGDQWDKKNIDEQRIVTNYILDVFKDYNLDPVCLETFTLKTGNIEHICTPIHSKVKQNFPIEKFLRSFSPTPALCGSPKEFAMKEIFMLENFDRGCYGGYCGPFRSIEDFRFNVVLRCAAVTGRDYCAYVGGGITTASDVAKEWEETSLKLHNTFPE